MGGFDIILATCGFVMREAALFAACGFLLLGLGDLAVDLIWIGLRLVRRAAAGPSRARPARPARRLRSRLGRGGGDRRDAARTPRPRSATADYRLYVGCYPNDPATIAAVRAAAGPRVRLVIGPAPGPTSKADCLNRLWERMLADEAAEGVRVKAVVLHDAEDVVHSAELRAVRRADRAVRPRPAAGRCR